MDVSCFKNNIFYPKTSYQGIEQKKGVLEYLPPEPRINNPLENPNNPEPKTANIQYEPKTYSLKENANPTLQPEHVVTNEPKIQKN